MALAVRRKIESSDNWRTVFYEFLDTRLDQIEEKRQKKLGSGVKRL